MYELPSLKNVQKVVLDESAVDGDGRPLVIYADAPKVAASK
jgi:ATP-dependent Clp protease ATP-binding subunit ClpX